MIAAQTAEAGSELDSASDGLYRYVPGTDPLVPTYMTQGHVRDLVRRAQVAERAAVRRGSTALGLQRTRQATTPYRVLARYMALFGTSADDSVSADLAVQDWSSLFGRCLSVDVLRRTWRVVYPGVPRPGRRRSRAESTRAAGVRRRVAR